jgi:HSP20 family protein
MALVTRWDPFEEMERLASRLEREPWGARLWAATPPVDVFETDEAIELRAELPGMKKEDLHIEVGDSTLTLSGERKLEHEDARDKYRRIESVYGSFRRSFTLPRNVDKEKIDARMHDGVLHLTIPKVSAEVLRRIPVHTEEEKAERPAVQVATSP